MSENDITAAEYREEISDLVDILVNEYAEYHDHSSEAVFEMVDSHQWIIYNGYNLDVLKHARNEPEEWAEFVGDTTDYRKVIQTMAFRAMELDVSDELHDRDTDVFDQ